MNKLLTLLCAVCFYTINAQNQTNIFLDSHFIGGHENFYMTVYPNIKYPTKARGHCVEGIINTKLEINQDGEIKDVIFSNDLGYTFKDEIKKALDATSDKWLPGTGMSLPLSFAFNSTSESDYNGDVTIISSQSINIRTNKPCISDRELFQKYESAMKGLKIDLAQKYLEEFIMRYPSNEEYKKLLNKIKREEP